MIDSMLNRLGGTSLLCPSKKCRISPVALMPPRWKCGDRVRVSREPEKCGTVIVSRCGHCARVEFEHGPHIDVGCFYDHELELAQCGSTTVG